MYRISNKSTASIDMEAAQWVARRDRSITADEQDRYLQWLAANPLHAKAVARHEAALKRMMQLSNWELDLSAKPNPDLLAPTTRSRRWLTSLVGFSAAAVLVFSVFVWWRTPSQTTLIDVRESYLRVNERESLSDGSIVDLKDGSRIEVGFNEDERRVRLRSGEAFFRVAKDSSRPFIVEIEGVQLHAVGTAFNVRRSATSVEVLVTEGKVQLAGQIPSTTALPLLHAGDQASVPLQPGLPQQLELAEITPEQIRSVLSWKVPRLQFYETPLRVAIAEFNRHGMSEDRLRVSLGDPKLGDIRIGGTFRVNNVSGFVRMLQVTMNIQSEVRGENEIVLLQPR